MHQFRYTNTNVSVSPTVDWDESDLLFTKRLQIMNKVIDYSYAGPFWTVLLFIINIRYTRLRVQIEIGAKFFGRFGLSYRIPHT